MLVLADPASKVTQIFVNAQKARSAILTYGFFPISPTGQTLPIQTTANGDILIDGHLLEEYLPPQSSAEPLVPYVRPMNIWASSSGIPYTPQLQGLNDPGSFRVFVFRPAGSPGCAETRDCFMTGHYDQSLANGPCSAPDPQEFHTLEDLQVYARAHGETLMELQSDQEVTRICGMTADEVMQRYAKPGLNLTSLLPYVGIGVAALLFLRRRKG